VAECIEFGEASGSNPNDVNLLYELISTIDPPLSQENIQNHVRWSTVNAYEILSKNKVEFKSLIEAFGNGIGLEECISIIEGADVKNNIIVVDNKNDDVFDSSSSIINNADNNTNDNNKVINVDDVEK
jgi:hypothetical protein